MFIGGQVSKSVFIHLPFLYLVSIDKSQTVISVLLGRRKTFFRCIPHTVTVLR